MPRRKALKVAVDVDFHAVTCPGVFLSDREDVFINVELMGQRKRTKCVPAVFPFLFHEKIRFEKVFGSATDPVQIATTLCTENVLIELVQLSYPTGNLLSMYEDNARDFLFPTPRITPTYPGVDREVLMQRSATFPGIAPKLEFSSRTIIKEVTSGGTSLSSGSKKTRHRPKSANIDHVPTRDHTNDLKKSIPKSKTSPKKKSQRKPAKSNGRGRERARSACNRATTMWGYEQPTIASRARSPSPYARRRMAQLSINDPFETATATKPFKTEIDTRPDFVVRKVAEDALSLENTPRSPRSISNDRKNRLSLSRSPRITSKHNGSYSKPLYNQEDETSEDLWETLSCISSDSADGAKRFQCNRHDYIPPSPEPRWHYLTAYSDYLREKNYNKFPEGRNDVICPIAPDHCRVIKEPKSAVRHRHTSFAGGDVRQPRHYLTSPKTINFVHERLPTSTPKLPVYDLDSADRITSQLQDILTDLGKVCRKAKVRHSRSPNKAVRFRDYSDVVGTSVRCGRDSPAVAPSTLSDQSPRSNRYTDSLSRDDLEPGSRYRNEYSRDRQLTPNSILLRTPLEERMNKRESPYEKIRDRVRTLLESPRAVALADDADRSSRNTFRRHRSRSPSPRSPRNISVRMTDKGDLWNIDASKYAAKSHRQVFEGNLDKMYDDIYNNIKFN